LQDRQTSGSERGRHGHERSDMNVADRVARRDPKRTTSAQSTAGGPKGRPRCQNGQGSSSAREQGSGQTQSRARKDHRLGKVAGIGTSLDMGGFRAVEGYTRHRIERPAQRRDGAEGNTTVAFALDEIRFRSKRAEVSKINAGWPVLDQAALNIFDSPETLPRPPSRWGAVSIWRSDQLTASAREARALRTGRACRG